MSHGAAPKDGALEEVIAPVRRTIIVACCLQAVAAVAGVVPFAAVAALGKVLVDRPIDDDRAWVIVAVAVGALFVRMILFGTATSLTHFADNDLQLHLRRRLADHLGRLPLGWFDERSSGEIKKALQDDVAALHHLVGHSYLDLTSAIVVPLACIAYLVTIDWRLALVTLIPLVLGVGAYGRMMGSQAEQMEAYGAALGRVNGASVEFVEGIAVVKAFGQDQRAHRRFIEQADSFVDFFWAWVKGLLRPSALAELVLSPLVALLVILTGGTLAVSQGWIEPIDVLPFALLGVALAAPFLTLNYAQQELMTARAAATRIQELLRSPEMVVIDGGDRPVDDTVVFDGVRFSYDGEHDVLSDVDLVLAPGTVTALVGTSGSGKTTIARLVARFWDPTGGAITIGGVDLRQLPTEELYRSVGFVFQDVQLLRTTVRDNVRLGRPDADDEAVEAAARAAQIHERITKLPRGYDSVVGEDALFSGGEAQRVSIARAVLADAPILVLDEATAFADPESEAAIQDALSTLISGRTLLVVAHRLHTISGADQIVVVDGGHIAERGTHDDLLAAGGRYRSLWDAATRGNDVAIGAEGAHR